MLAALISNAYAQSASESDKTAGKENVDKVTVTGYRSSLALSANEKRENIGLSDTVFSEDMGKFPDPNIADALSRVPGVTVTRASIDGEGMNVSIRGIGECQGSCRLNQAAIC